MPPMRSRVGLFCLFASLLATNLSLGDDDADNYGLEGVVFTILSRGGSYHSARAREKRQQWLSQLATFTQGPPHVLLAHELHLHGAAWTITPLLPYLAEHHPHARWFFFASEETQVDFDRLQDVLDHHDDNAVWFLGHSLTDHTRTIIHHYADHKGKGAIRYPNFPSGWALSAPALQRAAENVKFFDPNFNIDPQYELALFLKYMRTPQFEELYPEPLPPPDDGCLLTHTMQFCMEPELGDHCTTAYVQDIPPCGVVDRSKIFFGVKTCEKYHRTRLPVVQETWAPDAGDGIAYYSEVEDEEFLTTDIGIPNTESGHCGKMMAIIHKFQSSPELRDRVWLVITDDDTLLSVPRLSQLLSCYHSEQPILLGEVYGYNAERGGSSYVTGGGGMVLSRGAVERIVKSGIQCPSIGTPDDMFLGRIATRLSIDVIHSPLFHQAQPSSFHPAILGLQSHISFHRHHPSDPYQVYREYLTEPNTQDSHSHPSHKTEL